MIRHGHGKTAPALTLHGRPAKVTNRKTPLAPQPLPKPAPRPVDLILEEWNRARYARDGVRAAALLAELRELAERPAKIQK